MRKLIIFASIALATALTLSACQKHEQAAVATAPVAVPTSATDTNAWKDYLIDVVKRNMQGMTSNRPYLYFVPSGTTDEDNAARQNQFNAVHDTVLRTVLPGNLVAIGGPDSAMTADMLIAAFKDAKPESFKGVIVLFIGAQADKQRVADALAPSAAIFRFVEMK